MVERLSSGAKAPASQRENHVFCSAMDLDTRKAYQNTGVSAASTDSRSEWCEVVNARNRRGVVEVLAA
jgi:hypothetical protein